MAEHRWTLTSPNDPRPDTRFEVSAGDFQRTAERWRVTQRTLHSGLSQGVDIVEIDNGRMRVVIVPTRGMGIWRAWTNGQELGWRSPVRGPVHPNFVPLAEANGLGWLRGFDELMCRCGMESNGAPDFDDQGHLRYPLHGQVANLPAQKLELIIDDVEGQILLHGIVEESRVHFQKLRLHTIYTTRFDTTSLIWNDQVENFGGGPAEMQMLYHTNIGQPQLEAGSQVLMPIAQVAPGNTATAAMGNVDWQLYSPPRAGFQEQVFFFNLIGDDHGHTLALLKNSTSSSGVAVKFDIRQLPCFTLWRNLAAEADGYVTGLEPGTNFPNPRPVEKERGRIICLAPGDKWQAELSLDWLVQRSEVVQAEKTIAELQRRREPIVHAEPFF